MFQSCSSKTTNPEPAATFILPSCTLMCCHCGVLNLPRAPQGGVHNLRFTCIQGSLVCKEASRTFICSTQAKRGNTSTPNDAFASCG